MAAIEINQVSKIYTGDVHAVKSVSIDIKDGEFIVLVGPSGCGKSTLLRMVAGLEEISKGDVKIGNRVVNKIDPAERDIAMVFQNYALYPHMSVYENLAYGLRNRKTPKAEIDARVAEAARMLQLEAYLERKPRALSGGQRHGFQLVVGDVDRGGAEPAAFLFDEPLSNLDAKLRVSMRGEIEQIGAPLEVYHTPASTFVASFIGSPAMNLLKGELHGDKLALGPSMIDLAGLAPTSGPVTVGIRAEDLRLAGPGEHAMTVAVDYVEELGSQRLVHGNLGDQSLTAVLSPETELKSELRLVVATEKLHFFNQETGKRIGETAASPAAVVKTEIA